MYYYLKKDMGKQDLCMYKRELDPLAFIQRVNGESKGETFFN